MQHEFVVEVKDLFKIFGEKEVIRHCSMAMERGIIYGFLGKNRAGKPPSLSFYWACLSLQWERW